MVVASVACMTDAWRQDCQRKLYMIMDVSCADECALKRALGE